MIRFNVVKERYGWAIRMGECMTTPFWSRDMAVREANRLADAIGGHGERTEVVIVGVESTECGHVKDASLGWLDASLPGRSAAQP